MPLYEYECERCGHRFEVIQKFSDPLVDACPVCGGPVRKLLSSPAIQFKGSGWYITDYARAKDATRTKDTKETKDAKETSDTKETKDTKATKDTKSAADAPSAKTTGKSAPDKPT